PARAAAHRRPGGAHRYRAGAGGGGAAVPRERMSPHPVWLTDPDYPALLKQIHDPPARLYVNGQLPSEPMIAIVGSRRATPYGRRAAHRLARGPSARGGGGVSGAAPRIEAA